jgi:signal transduction histidine kinase
MPVAVFALFTVFGMANVGLTYLWLANRVAPTQVSMVALASWVSDLAFVVGLVVIEQRYYPGARGPVTDFHMFFFVLVLRGFALFRSPRGNLLANLAVVAAFLGTLASLPGEWSPVVEYQHWVRGVFILLLVVMSWMIVEVLNRQKEELAATRERLAQSENFAILGRLAGSLAHEMNNPMGIIAAHADYLLSKSKPGDPTHEDYAVLGAEARRCGRILSSLMQFSRGQVGRIGPVNLGSLAGEVAALLPSQRVELHFPEHRDEIQTDPAAARLALLTALIYAHSSHVEQGKGLAMGLDRDGVGNQTIWIRFTAGDSPSGESSTFSGSGFGTSPSGSVRPGLKAIVQAMATLGGVARLEPDQEHPRDRRIELVFPFVQP